jgi:hypothetical protein
MTSLYGGGYQERSEALASLIPGGCQRAGSLLWIGYSVFQTPTAQTGYVYPARYQSVPFAEWLSKLGAEEEPRPNKTLRGPLESFETWQPMYRYRKRIMLSCRPAYIISYLIQVW